MTIGIFSIILSNVKSLNIKYNAVHVCDGTSVIFPGLCIFVVRSHIPTHEQNIQIGSRQNNSTW